MTGLTRLPSVPRFERFPEKPIVSIPSVCRKANMVSPGASVSRGPPGTAHRRGIEVAEAELVRPRRLQSRGVEVLTDLRSGRLAWRVELVERSGWTGRTRSPGRRPTRGTRRPRRSHPGAARAGRGRSDRAGSRDRRDVPSEASGRAVGSTLRSAAPSRHGPRTAGRRAGRAGSSASLPRRRRARASRRQRRRPRPLRPSRPRTADGSSSSASPASSVRPTGRTAAAQHVAFV